VRAGQLFIIFGDLAILLAAAWFASVALVIIFMAKNVKLKSKVGMARGPVFHQQKQSSRVLRPN